MEKQKRALHRDLRFVMLTSPALLLERHQVVIRPTHAEFGFNGIRFSLHEFNTAHDVELAADAVRREVGA